jgi:predicted MFS family arabinose efflux permease
MAGMLSPYRRVLSLPGALAFSASGLFARMPMAMASLGIVLLVSIRTDSYSLAGAVSAAFLVGNAVCAVPQARLIDRLGQRRVLLPTAFVFGGALVALMACVEADAADVWLLVTAAVSGAALPQIGSSVRSRWSYLVDDRDDLHTAFAYESSVDELVFIAGPALVTALATAVHPTAGLIFAVVATVVGTTVLVGQRGTEPPVSDGRHDGAPGMPWRVLAPLIACGFMMGAMLGGAEVATVAFSDEAGRTALAGPMLAIWGIGSLVSGVLTGVIRAAASQPARFRLGMVGLGVLLVPLPFVDGFVTLGIALFLSGFAISPTLIAAFAWIESSVPSGRITEGITLFTTGLGAGLAPGAAAVGFVVDRSGASDAYWVVVAAGLLGAVVAVAATPTGSRARPADLVTADPA